MNAVDLALPRVKTEEGFRAIGFNDNIKSYERRMASMRGIPGLSDFFFGPDQASSCRWKRAQASITFRFNEVLRRASCCSHGHVEKGWKDVLRESTSASLVGFYRAMSRRPSRLSFRWESRTQSSPKPSVGHDEIQSTRLTSSRNKIQSPHSLARHSSEASWRQTL